MSELDDRLRNALGDLGTAAQRQVRSPGLGAVVAAGRRRRHATAVAGTALAVALAGGLTTGWWYTQERRPEPAGGGCQPATAVAFFPINTAKARVGAILSTSAAVTSSQFIEDEASYKEFQKLFINAPEFVNTTKVASVRQAWKYTLRCASDYPALTAEIATVPGIAVQACSCDPKRPDTTRPSAPAGSPTG